MLRAEDAFCRLVSNPIGGQFNAVPVHVESMANHEANDKADRCGAHADNVKAKPPQGESL